MFQRLRQRRLLDIGAGPGPERPTRGGDDDTNQLFPIAGTQRLKQRVMLGIRRQNSGPCFRSSLHEEVAGAHQALLVGQRHCRAAIDRG